MTSDISRSVSKKLSNLSKQRNIPYKNVLTEFLLERLLVRLVASKELSSVFIFKGGFVGRRAYGSPRYTVDLDALLRGSSIGRLETKLVTAIEKESVDGTWYRFDKKIDLQTQGEYPGVRFAFRAGIGEPIEDLKRAQLINFDIGIGDAVDPIEGHIDSLLDGASVSWKVYPREVIVAEKLHTFISRPLDNSRSKDLFDLLFHLRSCDPELVRKATSKTFETRGELMPRDIAQAFCTLRTTTLKLGWISAVSGLKEIGSFDDTFLRVTTLLEEVFGS